jgi:solute carrier family 25 oxoglutarate transporter 11
LSVADLIEPIHKQGLSAGLLRQATYTTARLGIHAKLVDYLKEMNKGAPLPLAQKAGAGLAAGGLGAIFGSPADLSLIRMQADKTLPVAERRNYTGVVHALSDTVKKEGIGGLFTGAGTTSIRAMALNMGMLASNDQAKEMMKENGITGFTATLGASSIAGFFASFFSLPFDYVKTQLQKQKPLPDGTLPFKGFGDCCAKTMAAGGPLKFYTGFPTYYVRIAPHAMFTLILLDQINVHAEERRHVSGVFDMDVWVGFVKFLFFILVRSCLVPGGGWLPDLGGAADGFTTYYRDTRCAL